MRNDILEKLSELLKDPIEREIEVVYLMVEARKLIEHKRKELEEKLKYKYYFTLTFYCDWCVHIELCGSTAQHYLKHIETLANQDNGINNKIFDFLNFVELEGEMKTFFREYNLDSIIFFNNWKKFLNAFTEVLAESPLLVRNPKPGQIKSLHFKKRPKNGSRLVLCEIDFEKEIDGGHYNALVGVI